MRAFFKWLMELLSLAANLVTLSEGITWGGLVGTLTTAAAFHYGADFLLVAGLVVVSIAIVWLGIGLIRSTWGLSRWYDHDAYYVWVAAWLWINCPPKSAKIDEKSPAYIPLQKIKGAIQAKKIAIISGDGGMRSYISREELKKLALDKGDQPKFLFPNAEIEKASSTESIRAISELKKQERLQDKQNLRREEIAHEKFVLYHDEKLIPLPDAAQIAYDELDGTLWREQADRWPKPEERLDFMATYIANNAPVIGCSPPSRVRKHIPQDEFRSGVFKNGGASFQRHYESHDAFNDMAVREEDFRDALKRMKAGS